MLYQLLEIADKCEVICLRNVCEKRILEIVQTDLAFFAMVLKGQLERPWTESFQKQMTDFFSKFIKQFTDIMHRNRDGGGQALTNKDDK